jgi:large subunit ribosomal protein L5e
VIQDKTKYAAHKYRLVVRFTNKDTICQIIYSKIQGDFVLAAAYGHELTRYGMPVGHTNYAAAYATGLLIARRTLKKIKLDTKYVGNKNITGEDFNVTPVDGASRPFKCFLDVGLRRCSTGNKVFAAMKGAADGGLYVPHSVNRLVGYDTEGKKLKADVLRKYIFGGHVKEHMEELEEEDPESYQTHYARYIKNKISSDNMEESWKKVHDAIRANPEAVLSKKNKPAEQKRHRIAKLTREQKETKLRSKKQSILSKNKAQE